MSGYNNFCVFLCVREGEIYIYIERNVVSCCGVIADRASVNVIGREYLIVNMKNIVCLQNIFKFIYGKISETRAK